MQIFMLSNFAILVLIFMNVSPKCRTKELGIIYSILGSFCSFFNWEGADIRPKSGLGKSLVSNSLDLDQVNHFVETYLGSNC